MLVESESRAVSGKKRTFSEVASTSSESSSSSSDDSTLLTDLIPTVPKSVHSAAKKAHECKCEDCSKWPQSIAELDLILKSQPKSAYDMSWMDRVLPQRSASKRKGSAKSSVSSATKKCDWRKAKRPTNAPSMSFDPLVSAFFEPFDVFNVKEFEEAVAESCKKTQSGMDIVTE